MGYLPYFDFGGEEYHFGYHVIVVAGYNPETRQVLMLTESWNYILSLGKTWQERVVLNTNPSRQSIIGILLISANITADKRRCSSFYSRSCCRMLEPPISNFGVKGIRKAANRF